MRGFFITGTDTGVGKTLVAAGLAMALSERGLRVVALKPVSCGPDDDAALLELGARSGLPPAMRNPVRLAAPAAPSVAARLEGRRISLPELLEGVRVAARGFDLALVEGAGGLLVPLSRDAMIADLAGALGLPVVVVARAGLGTVNHTMLTLEALAARSLPVAGLVISWTEPADAAAPEFSGPALLRELLPDLVAAEVPYLGDAGPRERVAAAAAALRQFAGRLSADAGD